MWHRKTPGPGQVLASLDSCQINEGVKVLERIWDETDALVKEHWLAIARVAQALLEQSLLNEAELDALIADRPGAVMRVMLRHPSLLRDLALAFVERVGLVGARTASSLHHGKATRALLPTMWR